MLIQVLLQSLRGQLGQLQLRHLLPLGRALVAPSHNWSGLRGDSSSAGLGLDQQQQQQLQLQVQPQQLQYQQAQPQQQGLLLSQPLCLVQLVPQLVGEYIQAVSMVRARQAGYYMLLMLLWTTICDASLNIMVQRHAYQHF